MTLQIFYQNSKCYNALTRFWYYLPSVAFASIVILAPSNALAESENHKENDLIVTPGSNSAPEKSKNTALLNNVIVTATESSVIYHETSDNKLTKTSLISATIDDLQNNKNKAILISKENNDNNITIKFTGSTHIKGDLCLINKIPSDDASYTSSCSWSFYKANTSPGALTLEGDSQQEVTLDQSKKTVIGASSALALNKINIHLNQIVFQGDSKEKPATLAIGAKSPQNKIEGGEPPIIKFPKGVNLVSDDSRFGEIVFYHQESQKNPYVFDTEINGPTSVRLKSGATTLLTSDYSGKTEIEKAASLHLNRGARIPNSDFIVNGLLEVYTDEADFQLKSLNGAGTFLVHTTGRTNILIGTTGTEDSRDKTWQGTIAKSIQKTNEKTTYEPAAISLSIKGNFYWGGSSYYTGDTTIVSGTTTLISATAIPATSSSIRIDSQLDISNINLPDSTPIQSSDLTPTQNSDSILELNRLQGSGILKIGNNTISLLGDSIWDGNIDGTGSVTIKGKYTFKKINTYSGKTTISGNDAVLTLDLPSNNNNNAGKNIKDANGGELGFSFNQLTGGGTLNIGSNNIRLIGDSDWGGLITGAGDVTIENGRYTFGAKNDYTGKTTIDRQSTLILHASNAIPTTSIIDLHGKLNIQSNEITISNINGSGEIIAYGNASSLTIDNGGTFSGAITRVSRIVIGGQFTWSGNAEYSNKVHIKNGTTTITSNYAISDNVDITIDSEGILDISRLTSTASDANSNNINDANNSTPGLSFNKLEGNGTLNIGSNSIKLTGHSNWRGLIKGTGDITIRSGIHTFYSANEYTGKTTIDRQSTLILHASNAIPTTSIIDLEGILDIKSNEIIISKINGAGEVIASDSDASLTINDGGNFSGIITRVSRIVIGGQFTWSGNAEYSNKVHIKNGTTTITSNYAISDNVDITIDSEGILDISRLSSTTSITNLKLHGTLRLGTQAVKLLGANGISTGSIVGAGKVIIDGIYTFTHTNSYNGSTNINSEATLVIKHSNSLPHSAILNLNGILNLMASDSQEPINAIIGGLYGSGTITASNQSSTPSSLTINGAGLFYGTIDQLTSITLAPKLGQKLIFHNTSNASITDFRVHGTGITVLKNAQLANAYVTVDNRATFSIEDNAYYGKDPTKIKNLNIKQGGTYIVNIQSIAESEEQTVTTLKLHTAMFADGANIQVVSDNNITHRDPIIIITTSSNMDFNTSNIIVTDNIIDKKVELLIKNNRSLVLNFAEAIESDAAKEKAQQEINKAQKALNEKNQIIKKIEQDVIEMQKTLAQNEDKLKMLNRELADLQKNYIEPLQNSINTLTNNINLEKAKIQEIDNQNIENSSEKTLAEQSIVTLTQQLETQTQRLNRYNGQLKQKKLEHELINNQIAQFKVDISTKESTIKNNREDHKAIEKEINDIQDRFEQAKREQAKPDNSYSNPTDKPSDDIEGTLLEPEIDNLGQSSDADASIIGDARYTLTLQQTHIVSTLQANHATSEFASSLLQRNPSEITKATQEIADKIHPKVQDKILDVHHSILGLFAERASIVLSSNNLNTVEPMQYAPSVAFPKEQSNAGIWLRAIGAWGKNSSAISSFNHSTFGVFLGADTIFTQNNLLIGFSGGYSRDKISISSTPKTHSYIKSYHFGIYGGTERQSLGIRTALDGAMHGISTLQTMTAFGKQNGNYASDYSALSMAVMGELAYIHRIDRGKFELFARGLGYYNSRSSFSETGPSSVLSASSNDMSSKAFISTLGARTDFTLSKTASKPTRLRAEIGWQHDYSENEGTQITLDNGAIGFTLSNEKITDAIVYGLGLIIPLNTERASLDIGYRGRYAKIANDHMVSIDLRIKM